MKRRKRRAHAQKIFKERLASDTRLESRTPAGMVDVIQGFVSFDGVVHVGLCVRDGQ